MHRPHTRLLTVVALLLGGAMSPSRAWALRADQLLLLTNKNVPDSRKLADRYASVRHVPDGRILELSLPGGDEIPFDQYERDVVPAVRQFVHDNHLESSVTCLVTFYGVPLKIGRRAEQPGDRKELAELQSAIVKARPRMEGIVVDFEKLAQKVDPTFVARIGGGGSGDASRRAELAGQAIERKLPTLDPATRADAYKTMMKVMEELAGPNTVTTHMARQETAKPDLPAADRQRWTKLVNFANQSRRELRQLLEARYDPAARAKARDLALQQFGLIEYSNVVQGQLEYLKPGDTAAALDSELSLLWWDLYPRAAWMSNPLMYSAARIPHPPVMMTARVDGPDVATVTRMMADSLRAEQDGLSGRLVVDAWGTPPAQYAAFDRRLMALADFVKSHPSPDVSLFLDVKPEVLPPNSATNVALYAGWYSVGKYVPGCKFVPGAVAVHIASYELTTMHSPTGAWVPNLLRDGAAASLGAVAEPYLNAFPLPDEFFPLLMTGRVTLAEAYWRTCPMASWMVALVGDPLYNPFAKRPAVRVEDLPAALRVAPEVPVEVAPATPP